MKNMACFLPVPVVEADPSYDALQSQNHCYVFCIILFHRNFVEEKLGAKYVERTRLDLVKAFEESSPATPVFFVLSPGVDALKDLEILGEWPGRLWACPPTFLLAQGPPFLSVHSYVSFFFFFHLLEIECTENVRLITL